ncbi:MAG: DMT family transporter [Acidimicrobiales bacterium]|nr:DMT family transporter [Acidimicrobiales bacterium]MCB1248338.1 DMT family transporter [Acidimicrobiales bacterium]
MTTTPAAAPSPGAVTPQLEARVRPMGAVWFASIVFSTGPVVVAGSAMSGAVFSFWRLWIGLPPLVAAAGWSMRRHGTGPTTRGWALAAVAGVAFGVHQVLFMTALKATSVVDVTLMNTLAPIVVGIAAVPMFGERPGLRFRMWSLLAILGAAGIAVLGSTGVDGNPAGMALAAGNVVAYATYFVLSKQARSDIDTWPFLLGALGTAAVVVSGWILVSGTDVGGIGAGDLVRCAFVAVVPGMLGHGAMTWAVRFVPANVPPVIMLTIPIFSGVLAWLVIGQTVTAGKIVAGAITLGGVLGAIRSPAAPAVAVEALDLAEET